MKDKNKGFNLGHFYFDYQSRNFLIQSVWMMDLWLKLADEYRLKNEITWELTDEKFKVGEKFVSKKWEDEFRKNQAELISELKGFTPFFTDDPIKEEALGFIILAAGYINNDRWVPFLDEKYAQSINSIYKQSRYYYLLSLCYKYFIEIQRAVEELFGIGVDDYFLDIDRVKEDMWYSTGDLLAYWSIDDKRRRSSQKGGRHHKKKEGIILSITALIHNGRNHHSAMRLWNYFKGNHLGEGRANEYGVYFHEDIKKYGEDFLIDNEKPGIKFNTFRRIVSEVKRGLNQK